jgi:hypothetical protein
VRNAAFATLLFSLWAGIAADARGDDAPLCVTLRSNADAYNQCNKEQHAEEVQRAIDFQRLGSSCDDLAELERIGATLKHVGSTYIAEAKRRRQETWRQLMRPFAELGSAMGEWTPDFFAKSTNGDGDAPEIRGRQSPMQMIQAAKTGLTQAQCYTSKQEAIAQSLAVVDQESAQVTKLIADEKSCRITPACIGARIAAEICADLKDRREVQKQINEEKANPGGVVDLELLHSLGERAQADDAAITSEKAQYAKTTHKPFTEALCHLP